MRIDRRRFVQWMWMGPVALALGSSHACRRDEPDRNATDPALAPSTGRSRDPKRLVAALRRHFHYLELDEASLTRYAKEYLHHLPAPDLAGIDLYTRFLLSNDFFQNGADESRPMHYLGLYDPYVSACRNPFARFDD